MIVKDDDGNKITFQKRTLLNSLHDTFELFKEEYNNVDMGRSSFSELRTAFVVPKAALAPRTCLCLYHENIGLILQSTDTCVGRKYSSLLQTVSDCVVCSTTREECMLSRCPLCKDFFLRKSRKMLEMAVLKLVGLNG